MEEKLLLTGEPGVGKSTLINRLYETHPSRVAGVVAREIRHDDRRVGFSSGPFEDPDLYTIAHVDDPSEIRVGSYGVNVAGLDGVADVLDQELRRAEEGEMVVVFDEVGWMQTFSERLQDQIETVLESETPAIMTIKKDDSVSDWLAKIKQNPLVRIITMTPENRDETFGELDNYVRRHTSQSVTPPNTPINFSSI